MRVIAMKSRIIKFSRALSLCVLFALPFNESVAQSTDHQAVNFLPVSISFSCQTDTPVAYQLKLTPAFGAGPEVLQNECVDKRNSITGVYPTKVALVYRRTFQAWSIVLFLNDKDALAVGRMSEHNTGKNMLIGMNGKVLVKGPLWAPISGHKLYICVESEKYGDAMMMHFVDPKAK